MISGATNFRAVARNRGFGAEGREREIFREVVDPITGDPIALSALVTNGGIDDMHAKGRLTDLQKGAADRLLHLYETAHSDGLRAIDYSKLRVDGMTGSDAFGGDRMVRAIKELAEVQKIVGDSAYAILLSLIVRGWSISQIAKAKHDCFGGSVSYKREKIAQALFRALDALDAHWNTAVGTGAGMRAETVQGKMKVETSPTRVEASTVDGATFVSGVSKLKDAALLRREGLAQIATRYSA